MSDGTNEQSTRKNSNNSSNIMYSIDCCFNFINENINNMKNKLLIPALILAFILGLFVKDFVCNNHKIVVKKNKVRKQWTRTKPLAHTIHFSDTTYIKTFFPDTIWKVITKHDTIYKTLQDYFAYVNVKDTIPIDTIGTLFLDDSLNMNRIIYRGYKLELDYEQQIISDKYLFKGSYGALFMHYDTTNVLGGNLSLERKGMTITGGYGKDISRLFEKDNNYYMITVNKNFEIKRYPLKFWKK